MAIRRRFKEEYDDDELEEDEEREDEKPRQKKIFRNKDFKDLNPKDKKSRKEPKKPWGRKERLLVLFTLLATVGISAFFYFSTLDKLEGPSFPKLNIPDVKIPNIFEEETIIYKKDITPTPF
jgi:hypothetical protein